MQTIILKYRYPRQLSNYQYFGNATELQKQLDRDIFHAAYQSVHFRYSSRDLVGYYGKCKFQGCPAHFKYSNTANDSSIALEYFINTHQHRYPSLPSEKKSETWRFFDSFSKNVDAFKRWEAFPNPERLGYKAYARFCKYRQCFHSDPTRFYSYVMRFPQRQYSYACLPQPAVNNCDPHMFIISTPKMKTNFKKFGQFAFLRVQNNFNIFKSYDFTVKEQWTLLLIEGRNELNQPIPFAFGMCKDGANKCTQFITEFFRNAKRRNTTLITKFQENLSRKIAQTKKQIGWTGKLLFERHSIIEQIIAPIQNQQLKEQLNKLLEIYLDKASFRNMIQKLSKQVADLDVIHFQKFKINADFCCEALTQNAFQGLKYPAKIDKVIDLTKCQLDQSLLLDRCTASILQYLEEMSQPHSDDETQYLFKNSKLLDKMTQSGLKFGKEVLQCFQRNSEESEALLNFQKQNDGWIFCGSKIEKVEGTNGRFICSCRKYTRSGIPCPHILAVCRQYHINPFPLIHKRWRIMKNRFFN